MFLVRSHFFLPPATSSKDVTTRLHAVPPISPPSFPHSSPHLYLNSLFSLSLALPSVEETPTGESEALQRGESTAVTSPFSAVSHHIVSSPPSNCHCTSWCIALFLAGKKKPKKVHACVRIVVRGLNQMNKNENEMNIMSGWSQKQTKKKKQHAYAEKN